jgi:hypothetical protein
LEEIDNDGSKNTSSGIKNNSDSYSINVKNNGDNYIYEKSFNCNSGYNNYDVNISKN